MSPALSLCYHCCHPSNGKPPPTLLVASKIDNTDKSLCQLQPQHLLDMLQIQERGNFTAIVNYWTNEVMEKGAWTAAHLFFK